MSMLSMMIKPFLPQLNKLTDAIHSIEKDYNTPKARIVIENELRAGKMVPVIKFEGVVDGSVSTLKDKNGVLAKFSIDKIVELISGTKDDDDDNE